ncbi:MAG: cell division protein CrgA [Actinomycetales bacterium]|jgi:hypothetical protein|nr:cell division protein CrgA [Actinomycetales bacterium]
MSDVNTDKQSAEKRKPIKPIKPAKPKAPKARKGDDLNPVWFKPVMFGFMLLGLIWIITYYVSSAMLPIQAIENWNILIGFGIAMVGFMMSTRWK